MSDDHRDVAHFLFSESMYYFQAFVWYELYLNPPGGKSERGHAGGV